MEDLTRFNEGVDQALAESVAQFEAGIEQAKETFLSILGHDLRTPLRAIQMSATFLLDGIFNPMKARDTPRAASARGPTGSLGLGLYIAERIVDAHGGRLDVESSTAAGTTFTVHLPRQATSTAMP